MCQSFALNVQRKSRAWNANYATTITNCVNGIQASLSKCNNYWHFKHAAFLTHSTQSTTVFDTLFLLL